EDDVTHAVQQIDPTSLKPVEALADRGRRVSCLSISADGELVAMGAPDGSVRVWNFAKKERVGGDRPVHARALWDVALTPDKKTLITGDKEGEVKIWDLAKNQSVRSFKTVAPGLSGLIVNASSTRVATYTDDGQVELWDLSSGKSLRHWELRVGVRALAFTPDGKYLVSGNDTSTLFLLELP